jgi:predicted DNA-binding transcriptional regulator AlpA
MRIRVRPGKQPGLNDHTHFALHEQRDQPVEVGMEKMKTPAAERNGLWNYSNVAEYLGISQSKAKRLAIPCVKLGRSVRFFPERVREWADAHSVPRRPRGTNG